MNNSDVAEHLISLRDAFRLGQTTPEELAPAFERLTFLLQGLTRKEEERLAGFVNDLERIRFGVLSENQPSAITEVLDAAQSLFDKL